MSSKSSYYLSVAEVNALSEEDRQNYREAMKRRRETNANIANGIFQPAQKKSKATSRSSDLELLSDFLEKNITVKPLALTPREYENKDPTDSKYDVYLQMSCGCESVSIPSQEEIDRVDKLKRDYVALKNDPNEPANFYERATKLQDEINSVTPKLKDEMNFLAEAVSHYHIALQMRQYCKQKDKLLAMKKWKEIEDALTCIGVSDFMALMPGRKNWRSQERLCLMHKRHLYHSKLHTVMS